MKRLLLLFVGIFAILWPSNTLTSQEVTQKPYGPTTLHVDSVRWRNYRYIGDILAFIPGFWIRDLPAVGNWSAARFRGSDDRHVTVLLDGKPLNDPWSGSCDLNLIPVEMIEEIELYPILNPFGEHPIGGAINLVSRRLSSNRPYSRVVYRSVQGEFSDTDVTFGQKLSANAEILSGVLLKRYGDFDNDYRSYDAQTIRSNFRIKLFSKLDVLYAILYNKSDLDVAFGHPVPGDTLWMTSPHRKRVRIDHSLDARWQTWGIASELNIHHRSNTFRLYDTGDTLTYRFPVQAEKRRG